MKLRTRFMIAILVLLLGLSSILGLTYYLIIRINELNQADEICSETINTLNELQVQTAKLLSTQVLDETFKKWKEAHNGFQKQLEILNNSPDVQNLLETEEQKSILQSMNTFWDFTFGITSQVEKEVLGLMRRKVLSRDGLIFQYADTNDFDILVIRDNVINALLFLESEFEIKLSKLVSIVEQEKASRLRALIIQICVIGLVIAVLCSSILISFLTRLGEYFSKLHFTMGRIGKGDFTFKMPLSRTKELSQIATTINMTTDYLQSYHAEREQYIQDLSAAKDEAELANRSKTIFLANMSHEIRTPLNAVTGFSELLASLVVDKRQKSYLAAIKQAGKSLLTLINDILDLSKIEADKLEIQYSPVNLWSILNEVEQIFAVQAGKKDIEFIKDISEEIPEVLLLDEIRLRQILFNIVGNAVKFTETGHIKLTVDASFNQGSSNLLDLLISIEDTGEGIPEEEFENIFDAFRQQTGQDSSKFGGTGLGLAISKRLVEMMNGEITLESVLGEGSVFKIMIHSVEIPSDEISLIDEPLRHEMMQFQEGKVLVVDDAQSNRDFMTVLLAKLNLEVLSAEGGQQAIELSSEFHPDVILMDIRMPEINGVEAMERIKANNSTRSIPIIAVTAMASRSNQLEMLGKGFDGFLAKPVVIHELISQLSKHLQIMSISSTNEFGELLTSDGSSDLLPAQTIAKLQTVLEILQSDFMKKWHGFKEVQPVDEVKAFGDELKILGDHHEVEALSKYGKQLVIHVDNFDVNSIQLAIAEFPGIILQMQKTIEDKT